MKEDQLSVIVKVSIRGILPPMGRESLLERVTLRGIRELIEGKILVSKIFQFERRLMKDRKERKAKERKGKERKGKERKGKDRKG